MDIAAKVKQFFKLDQESKVLTKLAEPIKVEIKDFMRAATEKTFVVDDIQAEFTIQNRQTVNELRLLAKLKKLKRKDLIKKIEVPNMDAIETLIYNQELDADLLADCVEIKQVEVLKVGKVKKTKKGNDDEEVQDG